MTKQQISDYFINNMTKQEISNYFIELLNHLEIKTSPDYPNWLFYLYKDKLYIDYDQKNNQAWLSYDKIWSVFESKYLNNYEEIQGLTQSLVEEHLKLRGVTTTQRKGIMAAMVEEHLKLGGVTTIKYLKINF